MSSDDTTIEMRTTRRTKRLRVTVYPGGRVVLSRPRWATERDVARFLMEYAQWIAREVARLRGVRVPQSRMRGTRPEYVKRKEEARARIAERIAVYAPRYGLTPGRIAIKNMRSRWGSCSAKGNLNFHYKAVDLPEDLLDYLVVHELCHLREMNHGPRFWALVAQEIPEYRTLRTRLRSDYA